ncbi:MAG: CRTAC1 family protein [Pirellulales bacterium]
MTASARERKKQVAALSAIALAVLLGYVGWRTWGGTRTPAATPSRETPSLAAPAGAGPADPYPESTPGKSPASARQPSGVAPGFRDVAAEAGVDFRMRFLESEQGEKFKINLYDHGCGVAVGDLDGDGDDDLYFCNQLGPNGLYRNEGGGRFANVTSSSGPVALDDRICVGATFADYDNDGDQDLYVTSTRGGNVLLQNDGRGVFRDATDEAGLALVAHSQTGAFFDYDLDGDLDLIVTNTAEWTTAEYRAAERYFLGAADLFQMWASPRERNVFYRNEGNGKFADVTNETGLAGRGWAGDTTIFDYDEDGRPDLLITNMFGQSQLYRNQPEGQFVDVTRETLKRTSWGAIGSIACDFRNRGRLDLFIADMHSDMWVLATTKPEQVRESRKYEGVLGPRNDASPASVEREQKFADLFQIDYKGVVFGNSLFFNLGQGRFEESSDWAGAETFWPWGLAAGDFDGDRWQDVFVPAGMGHPYCYWRNSLLMNNGDATFTDRSRERGIEPRPGGNWHPDKIGGQPVARSSRCAATLDFDLDGRLDLVVSNFNDVAYLYRNEFPQRHYVQFRLQGTASNRDAIGAVVRLYQGEDVLTRQVNAAGGYLSHSSKTLHFGLGDQNEIERVEIRWPSGKLQTLEKPASDRLHVIVEPAAE